VNRRHDDLKRTQHAEFRQLRLGVDFTAGGGDAAVLSMAGGPRLFEIASVHARISGLTLAQHRRIEVPQPHAAIEFEPAPGALYLINRIAVAGRPRTPAAANQALSQCGLQHCCCQLRFGVPPLCCTKIVELQTDEISPADSRIEYDAPLEWTLHERANLVLRANAQR